VPSVSQLFTYFNMTFAANLRAKAALCTAIATDGSDAWMRPLSRARELEAIGFQLALARSGKISRPGALTVVA